MGVPIQVTKRKTMVVVQKTGAPMARAEPTTEKHAKGNCVGNDRKFALVGFGEMCGDIEGLGCLWNDRNAILELGKSSGSGE